MDKYTKLLDNLPFDLLHIAQSYANDNKSPKIEPAHLLRALLHKSAGLVHYIEDTLDEDYYYLVDWTDMRMQQCDKSPYTMKGIELSHDSENVVKEAAEISEKCGLSEINAPCLLASLVTPGIGFTYEQLKTIPLQADKIVKSLQGDGNISTKASSKSYINKVSNVTTEMGDYCLSMMDETPESSVIGFDNEIMSVIEVLARKDRANILVVGETGVG